MEGISALALDLDGVLTDGTFWWGPAGEEFKQFCFLDIMGISLGSRAGLVFALISGESSPLVDRFAAKMSIKHVYKGCKDKGQALRSFSREAGIPLAAIGFMGDDVNDLPAMELAGFTAAPANAHRTVKERAHRISEAGGGHGAVREIIDFLLEERRHDG